MNFKLPQKSIRTSYFIKSNIMSGCVQKNTNIEYCPRELVCVMWYDNCFILDRPVQDT